MKQKLSGYIFSDLKGRIARGALPARWSLSALAREYGVSAMPVRVALRELVAKRLLLQKGNGRFAVNPAKAGRAPFTKGDTPPQPPVDWKEILSRKIIGISLHGNECELKIADVATEHGISATLVHTVFHRLAGIGLLTHVPRRGWAVRPFRLEDLDAFLEVRESLELLALRDAREKLQTAELKRLLALNQPAPPRSPAKIDNSLHRYWIDLSGNRYIMDFFERQHTYFDTLLSHAVLTSSDLEKSRAIHRRILEALIRRDWAAAELELSRDVKRLRPLLQATMLKIRARR